MKKNLKKLLIVTFIVVLFSSNFGITEAIASQDFYQPDLTSETFRSPARDSNLNDIWPHINSAWNQPRNVSTSNPHQGVDLRMTKDTKVYSVFDGVVVQKEADWILIKRSNANYYMAYKHIVPKSSLSVGSPVSINDDIGKIQDISGAHLHFGLTTNSSSTYDNLIWAANNKPYSHVIVDNWEGGLGLDFMKRHSFSGGSLYIYVKASDDYNNYTDPKKVVLYHRKKGTTTWNGPVTMNKGTNNRYSYNFGALGYYNGDQVDWLVVGYRDGPFVSGRSNWAYYPAYYGTQAEIPNSNSKYYTYTVYGLPPQSIITPSIEEENNSPEN